MEISKEVLVQYADLQQEIKYLREKIDSLQNEQAKLEDNKKHSSVKGSMEDFPYTSHNVNVDGYVGLTTVSARYLESVINNEIRKLESRYENLLQVTNDTLDFIESVNDSHIRMIITYRIIESYSWRQVADAMGGGNTEDSVRKAFERFMEKE